MIVAAIIIIILLLILLLRFGVILEYADSELTLWLKAGFLKIRINLDDTKPKKKPKRDFDLNKIKPGSLSELLDILKIIKELLLRIKHKLLIKRLIIHFTAAGEDPAETAIMFGGANAALGMLEPILDRNFRIKRHDVRLATDFCSTNNKIYVLINISIAVWEALYVASAALPFFTSITGKEEKTNGQRTNKQSARHDDAENQGDDRS